MSTNKPKDQPDQPTQTPNAPDAEPQDGGTDPGVPEGPGKTPSPPPPVNP